MVKEMFLITAEITYHFADDPKIKIYRKINTVTARDTEHAVIKGADLIYATNAAIGNFHEHMEQDGYAKDSYAVDDVVILNIINMGVQDADTFMPKPEEKEPQAEAEEKAVQ